LQYAVIYCEIHRSMHPLEYYIEYRVFRHFLPVKQQV
jgi:hypothetical protein